MIISIGEVVWDMFPDRRVLGGAPVNVAYHLHSLGVDVKVITRIGTDKLGKTTTAQLNDLGLPLKGIQKDGELPTGKVNVTVDEYNEPHFDIVAPAAWDNIDTKDALGLVGDEPFQMVFGTLAQRDPRSRNAIRTLWDKASMRFYDVNLRPPFTTPELVLESLRAADLVKMNGEELVQIGKYADLETRDKKACATELLKAFNISVMAVTEGAEGAWLVTPDNYFEHPGTVVKVADTVGAGDAFFATLIQGYINNRPWHDCLARANQRGAYVASMPGATPPMPEK
ncbi:MAG: carbohydrate kinase [Desulfobulbaceae bacterium]|nr:carbohydrate kinase [Desulfobulbaceae bacterium]MCK5323717.1 carbohydrate kinase [Desulfobulbaceae bacterium]